MMLVLTSNQYLKLGFEALIKQQDQCVKGQIIIFDAGERLFFLQEPCRHEYYPADLFVFLIKSKCFLKRDIDTPEEFFRCLNEVINRAENLYTKSSDALSRNEVFVLEALCKGWSTFKIANLFNKSIKTVSTQKSRALRKLGMRNMQMLHRTMVQWHILTKEFNSTLPRGKHSMDLHNWF
ncbi:hypothetical protein BIY27_25830 [Gibbsiella quercinecans]|uniref:helix-turn-helix domain-containing protein n=1 Tax=Gibbsiella quercinecans TaxID=929813 RepID=UPI000EF201C9|nr:LuxR C-terminal-related transcriptional regulator [Gibbsiella quercinecans]RLM02103.1 hypothetical protein BIY27_25830 [Gibbsiella quercinecans]